MGKYIKNVLFLVMDHRKGGIRMVDQKSYTPEDWLNWLYQIGGGRLVRESSIETKCPKQYAMIMALFQSWDYVTTEFYSYHGASVRKIKAAVKPEKMPTQKVVVGEEQEPPVQEIVAGEEQKTPTPQVAKADVPQKPVEAEQKKRRNWTKDGCIDFLRRLRDQLGRMPTQGEVCTWSVELDGPSYATLLKHLGKKDGWQRLLDGGNVDEARDDGEAQSDEVVQGKNELQVEDEPQGGDEPQNENEPRSEQDIVQVISAMFHSVELDLTLNGTRMKVHVDFGPAEKE